MRGILTLASLTQDDGGKTDSTRYNLFDLFIRIITCSMSGIPRFRVFAMKSGGEYVQPLNDAVRVRLRVIIINRTSSLPLFYRHSKEQRHCPTIKHNAVATWNPILQTNNYLYLLRGAVDRTRPSIITVSRTPNKPYRDRRVC